MAKGKKGRGTTFTTHELDILLKLVEERLPMGGEQWEALTNEYNRGFPADRQRDMDSLRLKFKTLKNKRKPTGDPTCPPEVRRAKQADRAIQQQMGVENFDDEEEELDQDGDNVSVANEENDEDDEDATQSANVALYEESNHGSFVEPTQDFDKSLGCDVVTDTCKETSGVPPLPSSFTKPSATVSSSASRRTQSKKKMSSSAGIARTGYTAKELLSIDAASGSGTNYRQLSSASTPSPTPMMSSSSLQKRKIDQCLESIGTFCSKDDSNEDLYPQMDSFSRFLFMQQMQDNRRREDQWRREQELAEERERVRREEARESRAREERMEALREEREARREQKQTEMMTMMLALLKK